LPVIRFYTPDESCAASGRWDHSDQPDCAINLFVMSDGGFSAEEEELRQKLMQLFKDMDKREEKYWEEQ
jgi:hypothetical protein